MAAIKHHQSKLRALITQKYKSLQLQPEDADFWVMDHRNENLLGPYQGEEKALTFAKDLNDFIKKGGVPHDEFYVYSKEGVIVRASGS